MGATYRTLTYRSKLPLVYVTISRPRAANRVNLPMAAELRLVCQQIREEPGARVVIVTGKGDVFSSGREPINFPRKSSQTYPAIQWLALHQVASAVAGLEIPIIAAINGNAIDHGLELALACDLRIAVRGSRMGFTDVSKGVLPWDGGTQRLPRLVGRTLAMDMLLTSRLVDAEEAYRSGLVNMLVGPDSLLDTAEKVALEVAEGAPIAARYAKETILKGMDMTLEQGLRLEADLNLMLQSTKDRTEGLRSFLEKRHPMFLGE